jgi:uncharacterized protein
MRMIASMFLAASLVIPVAAQTPAATRPHIRVTGEGEVAVKPDRAKLQMGVTANGAVAGEAANRSAEQTTRVIAAIRAVLGAGANIETVSYNLNPNYTYPRDGGQPSLTGYTATNIVEATIDNLALVGKAIDEGIKAGANRVNSLRFMLRNDAPQREQAMKAAVAQARSKAQALASGANVRLGGILSVTEGGGGIIPPPMPMGRMQAMAAESVATPVESGQVEVRVLVVAEFEILQ